ncbi:hypothetical protein SEE_04133 [Salmonella enterica subsp. enterica serovar Typhimurium str. TN061786]|nr:hypothetical protein SEE_04133 [Salmonella enterica subsp. enterica serovar Typhimurium str. TN061786]
MNWFGATGVNTICMVPNGQATTQDLQPMHFCALTCTLSLICAIAPFGQLRAQGASSQW